MVEQGYVRGEDKDSRGESVMVKLEEEARLEEGHVPLESAALLVFLGIFLHMRRLAHTRR